MIDPKPSPIVTVEPSSEDDTFIADWGRELFKSSVSLANDVLKQSIVISSLLLSGALAFLDRLKVSRSCQAVVFGLLLAMLLIAFFSLLPEVAIIDARDPAALRDFRTRILRRKRRAVQWIGGLLAGAFVAAIAGVMLRTEA